MTRLILLALLAVCGVVGWRWGRRENEPLLIDWVTGRRLPRREWLALQASRGVPDAWRDLERVDAV